MLEQALEYHRAGRLDQAEAIYREVLAREPEHADALHLLGVLAAQRGQPEKGAALIRRAIRVRPDVAAYHNNLGEALRALGKPDEAIEAYRKALALEPRYPEAHDNLGSALYAQRRVDEAVSAFREAAAANPAYAPAHNNLGVALQAQGDLQGAITAFRQALQRRPDYVEACNNLGVVLERNGKPSEALPLLEQARDLNPRSADVRYNLGNTFEALGRVDDALSAYREALRLDPRHARAHSNLLLCMHYQAETDPQALFAEHRRWDAQHARPLAARLQQHDNDRTPNRRLRIGYVSPDFRSHSVARFIAPLLAAHDREAFEVICYADVAHPDAVTARLRGDAQRWHDVNGLTDDELSNLVRDDGVDILVDLAGHTAGNRLLAFARQPAPVQVTYLGYPNTTGLSAVDYRLTDAVADPPGEADILCIEELVRLPQGFHCYEPPVQTPGVGNSPVQSAGHVTFACFNNVNKINREVASLWGQILRTLPGSCLLLKAGRLQDHGVRGRIRSLFEREGLSDERIEMLGWATSIDEHLRTYSRADIALDTFPYNGTTTTCEALWMGVPVVALAGTLHAGRVGVSLLTHAGLPELIAENPENYVKIAVALALDREHLKELRQGLRERLQRSPLTDAVGFTRSLERAYRTMWETYCSE